jgi:hypothetical protein
MRRRRRCRAANKAKRQKQKTPPDFSGGFSFILLFSREPGGG